jgi:class 3 adenylate cyclase
VGLIVGMEQLQAAVRAAGAAFADDEVLVGQLSGGTLRFVGGSPPKDKDVWVAIGAALEAGTAQDAAVSVGAVHVHPLSVAAEVQGVVLVHRSQGSLTAAERTMIALLADRIGSTIGEQRAREELDSLLRRFMPYDVAQALINDPQRARLGGSVHAVTVMFADLRGFTSYSEQYPPDQVVAMLNHYFDIAVPIIISHGGTITDFIGDAVMAIFNAPAPQPEHVLLAARAGLAVQTAIEAEAARRPGWPRFRVGIHTGSAVVGNIGSLQRRAYTAIGDTVNVAARLEGLAEAGTVVISADCLAVLGAHAQVRPLGTLPVKGRAQPIETFVLDALHSDPVRANETTTLTRADLEQLRRGR